MRFKLLRKVKGLNGLCLDDAAINGSRKIHAAAMAGEDLKFARFEISKWMPEQFGFNLLCNIKGLSGLRRRIGGGDMRFQLVRSDFSL